MENRLHHKSSIYLLSICLLLSGCGPATIVVGITPGDQQVVPTVVQSEGYWVSDRVAIIEVAGLIHNGRSPGLISEGENPVSLLTECLTAAEHDDDVKAVILRINSPGGTVTASDAMYREVRRFRQHSGKPVVALMLDVAASGGYYLACAADDIVAYPSTITASIGVILQTISFKEALNSIHIKADAITSGPNKDAGSPLSDLTPEQRKTLAALVDDFYKRFLGIVRERRPLIPADKFAMVTDGRVLSGSQALALGLVDQNGDLHDAFDLAKKLAHLDKANLVVYHRPLEYVGSAYAHAPGNSGGAGGGSGNPGIPGGTQINFAQINIGEGLLWNTAGFYYLWSPQ
jgi:protease-4